MVEKIQKKKSRINFSNKLFYLIVVFGISLFIGVGVSAWSADPNIGTPSVMGHSAGELEGGAGLWSPIVGGIRSSELVEIFVDDADSHLRFHDPGNYWYSMGIDQSDGGTFKINYGGSVGATDSFAINNAGNVVIGSDAVTKSITAGSFIYNSDRRLKENIQVIPNALEKVKMLEGVSFEWISDETNDKNLGFIAQDVERVLPEVVSTNEDGFKAVEYGNIIAVLVEAIKEQQKEIEELKLKLDN